jgi:hypothetical protein
MLFRLQVAWSSLQEALHLPRVTVRLGNSPEAQAVRRRFMAPHPKFPLLGRKQLGACLIDLREFEDFEDYLATANGNSSAAYLRRKRRRAMRCGYTVRAFTPPEQVEELKEINSSAPERQGRKMAAHYLSESFTLPCSPTKTPYGVFTPEGRLVGYIVLGERGEVGSLDMILGHADHLEEGVMYLLVSEVVALLMRKGQARYCFYDMWYGASEGLRTFKKRCGFKPYFVSWE